MSIIGKPLKETLNYQLPPTGMAVAQGLALVGGDYRPKELAEIAHTDIALAIRIIKASNQGMQTAHTVENAIMRLGSEAIVQLLIKLREEENDPCEWIELHRTRGNKIRRVAALLAETLARNLIPEVELAAILTVVGDILAVIHLGYLYGSIVPMDGFSRVKVNYALVQEYKFDPLKVGSEYALNMGIPTNLIIQQDVGDLKDRKRIQIKPIILSAIELVDAQEQKRIDRYKNLSSLPSSSNVRYLSFVGSQYDKTYEGIKSVLV